MMRSFLKKCPVLSSIALLGIFLVAQGCANSPFDAFSISTENRKLSVLNYDDNKERLAVENSPFDVGQGADDIVYDPRHKRVYVTNSHENSVSVFKMELVSDSIFQRHYALQELEKIATGEEPIAVEVDTQNNLVLVLHRDGTLMRISGKDLTLDGEKNVLRGLIFSSEAADLAYDARHGLLYVIDQGADAIVVLDGTTLTPLNFVKTPVGPCSLLYDDVNDRVYVTTLGDQLSGELPGLSIYKAGPHCFQVREPLALSPPYQRCPVAAFDDIHNLLYVGYGTTRVYDAASLELIDELETSLPYSLATGKIDRTQTVLLYLGQPGSIRVYEIRGGADHVYLDEFALPGPADHTAAVSPACPEIISIEPQEGKVGETVGIVGLNFGDRKGMSLVAFGGAPISEDDVVSWSDTNIQVKVPEMARTGEIRVVVGNSSSVWDENLGVDEFEVIPGRIIHVSANNGSNRGDGSAALPYQTLTYALSKAQPSDVLYVHGGRYTRALGERFPLEVGEGVRVEGYESPPTHFQIIYSPPGDYALTLSEGASIYNMGIYVDDDVSTADTSAIGIFSGKNSLIEEMVVAGFRKGVVLDGGINDEICSAVWNSDISACEVGIEVRGDHTNAEIANNNLFENRVAIDLGGDANRVVSNDISENGCIGVKISGKAAFIFANTIFLTQNRDPDVTATGVWGNAITHSFINGNQIYNNEEGVFVSVPPGYHNFIRGNIVQTNSRNGIRVAGDGFCVLDNNDIRENQESGVFLMIARSRLQTNAISNNLDGITVSSMTRLETVLADNRLYGNTRIGLDIYGNAASIEERVSVRVGEIDGLGNTISNNGKGIYLSKAWAYVFNNTILDNEWGVFVAEQGVINMGSADSPGHNTIRNSIHVGLANHSDRTIRAAGNSWNPDVQGAGNDGNYLPGIVEGPVQAQDGNNYSIDSQYGKIEF